MPNEEGSDNDDRVKNPVEEVLGLIDEFDKAYLDGVALRTPDHTWAGLSKDYKQHCDAIRERSQMIVAKLREKDIEIDQLRGEELCRIEEIACLKRDINRELAQFRSVSEALNELRQADKEITAVAEERKAACEELEIKKCELFLREALGSRKRLFECSELQQRNVISAQSLQQGTPEYISLDANKEPLLEISSDNLIGFSSKQSNTRAQQNGNRDEGNKENEDGERGEQVSDDSEIMYE
ncbi:hypothetical protein Tcan_04549 [Toxocara canis]|uniref:Uncharacterized protein n=1 Tax=Toxocara canis TaxID=6265 RepID=A0A0B2V901_TOXCA|nr:hypothetical protein Tcan_04549 [Toxocara canis]